MKAYVKQIQESLALLCDIDFDDNDFNLRLDGIYFEMSQLLNDILDEDKE